MQTVEFPGVPERTAEGEQIFSDDVAEFSPPTDPNRVFARRPWPLTRAELTSFRGYGLRADSIVDFIDHEEHGPVRRWRAWFTAPDSAGRVDPV